MKAYRLPAPIEQLAESFSSFPGIGPKLAQRLALYAATHGTDAAHALQRDLGVTRDKIQECSTCGNLSLLAQCEICRDAERDGEVIMVVESPLDVVQIEQTHSFSGYYLVLGGVISPLNGVGPEGLRINLLLERLRTLDAEEVILALPATVEGDATALYIAHAIHEQNPKVKTTKLAKGLPTGATLEFLDADTLFGALQRRVEVAN